MSALDIVMSAVNQLNKRISFLVTIDDPNDRVIVDVMMPNFGTYTIMFANEWLLNTNTDDVADYVVRYIAGKTNTSMNLLYSFGVN